MGGGGQTQGPSYSQLSIPTATNNSINQTSSNMQGQNSALQSSIQGATSQLQPYANSFQVNPNFAAPNFSQGLDQMSQNVIGQGLGNIAAKTAAGNANIAQQFGGNSGASGVLQAQNNMGANLAGNALPFQAAKDQQARQAQNYELGQRSQSLSNDANMQLLQAPLQLQATGIQGNQNLLSTLSSLAGLQGVSSNTPFPMGGSPLSQFTGIPGTSSYTGYSPPGGK